MCSPCLARVWARLGFMILEEVANTTGRLNLELVTAGLFDDAASVDECFSGRVQTLMTIMDSLISGDLRVTSKNYATELSKLKEKQTSLTLKDLQLVSIDAWVSFWANSLENKPEPQPEPPAAPAAEDEKAEAEKSEQKSEQPVKDEKAEAEKSEQKLEQPVKPVAPHAEADLAQSTAASSNVIIHLFMKKLETFVHESMLCGAFADCGYSSLRLSKDKEEDGTTCIRTVRDAERMSSKVRLNFGGRVTKVPKENSIPMCKAFDHQFYIEPGQHMIAGNGEVMFPAWLVAKERGDAENGNLTIIKREVDFEFSYTSGAALQTLITKVDLYFLATAPHSMLNPDVMLVRKTLECMISKAKLKSMNNEKADVDRVHNLAQQSQGTLKKQKSTQDLSAAAKQHLKNPNLKHLFR